MLCNAFWASKADFRVQKVTKQQPEKYVRKICERAVLSFVPAFSANLLHKGIVPEIGSGFQHSFVQPHEQQLGRVIGLFKSRVFITLCIFQWRKSECTVVEFIRDGVTKLFQKDQKAVQWICSDIWQKNKCMPMSVLFLIWPRDPLFYQISLFFLLLKLI